MIHVLRGGGFKCVSSSYFVYISHSCNVAHNLTRLALNCNDIIVWDEASFLSDFDGTP